MAIGHLKQNHPLLHDIFEYYTYAQHQHKSVMFCWVPSHVGIQGNEPVDALARLALNESFTNIKIPYADLVCTVPHSDTCGAATHSLNIGAGSR